MQPENGFIIALKNIWPRIYRIINSFLYFTINLIKSIISYSIQQIKGL